ncbi:MAG TPA: class I SAM-dependent methyltransferase [Dermatophilaceae bacterium]
MTFEVVARCRSCGSNDLAPVLDLGPQPLANAYREPGDPSKEARYPLALLRCRDCSLVQLTGTIPPKLMFDTYHYFSSYSSTMVDSMRVLAKRLTAEQGLTADDLVVEIASNDGYLLKHYLELGIPVLGVEPAKNVAAVARESGVPTLSEYFTRALGSELAGSGRSASVIHANNVMAHVPEINDFVAGISAALRPDGVAVVETPYLVRFVDDREFDTTYHEHVFYYSLTAVSSLVRRHGLTVADVEEIPLHGGSLRLFIQHAGVPSTERVQQLLRSEQERGVTTDEYYSDFANRVEELKTEVTDLILKLRAGGASIAAYGAAAKGTVLLNHFGLDRDVIDFVVDRSEHKQGLLMPGVGIPILAAEELERRRPDYTLLLAWNFAGEILEQQHAYRAAGGTFIIPVPTISMR